MIVTILATGSRGDTQPYLALGLGLKRAGHRVRIAAFENFESFVTGLGLEFCRVTGDVARVAAGAAGANAMQADNPLKVLLSFRELQAYVFDLQQDFFDACVGSDIIVYHPGAAIGYFIARHLNVPAVLATPFPMTPTREYPSLLFYDKPRLGRTYNLLTHKVLEQIMWSASRAPVQKFWQQKFGRLPRDFGNPFARQNGARFPTIISCSNSVFPQAKDWSPHVHQTGYWFLDDEPNWQPSERLQEFLRNGPPPVYVGFGSMANTTAAAHVMQLVIEALRKTGQRGILATGWSGLTEIEDLPHDVFVLDSAPHAWLFPQMAAVVHHGGAGTTAAGLRAGVPAVVIPNGNDQPAWGRRVYELGAGPRPIPRKRLTAENLAEAIQLALQDKTRSRAKSLGTRIQSERGVETAVRVILDCAQAAA